MPPTDFVSDAIHGHNAGECDVIVCWRHNWKECPLRVIELSTAVKELKAA